ncbi:hypothetical protein [Flavobacterium hydatis]|jgi:hypothetical protein|uniref:hypothetical protein n=1 Tax=Flavobacterium hydatis TaxID=991 RepID=UPI000A92BECF|nr:hypothetical protein [Flavobacterium hydatis]
MLKKILKLEGAQQLTRSEQKIIKGGLACGVDGYCPGASKCVTDCKFSGICRPYSYVEC